jgi:hypothetical protein
MLYGRIFDRGNVGFQGSQFAVAVRRIPIACIALLLSSCTAGHDRPPIRPQTSNAATLEAPASNLDLRPLSREEVVNEIIGKQIDATSLPVAGTTGDGPENFSADGSYLRRADRVMISGEYTLVDARLCISVRYAAQDDCRAFYYGADGKIIMEYIGRNPRAFAIINAR